MIVGSPRAACSTSAGKCLRACSSWSWRKAAVLVPTRTSPGHLTARPSKSFLQCTAGLLTGRIIDCRSHSTHVFLNHAQMDSKSVQVDFEWACALEQPNGEFNFSDSCLTLDDSGSVCALIEFAFEVSQSPV